MKNLKKIIVATVFVMALFSVKSSNAQTTVPDCNYTIHLGTQCGVSVQVEYYDSSTTICSTQTLALNQGPNYINCQTCTGVLFNLVATILNFGGAPISVTAGTVDNGTNYQTSINGSIPPGTCATTFQMQWAFNSINISE